MNFRVHEVDATRTAHEFRAAIILDVDRVILEAFERPASVIRGNDDYIIVPTSARNAL